MKAWFKNSLTIFWARLCVFVGAAVAIFLQLGSDPATSEAIKQILKPEYVPYYVIIYGVITELCRRRTVSHATDENNNVVS